MFHFILCDLARAELDHEPVRHESVYAAENENKLTLKKFSANFDHIFTPAEPVHVQAARRWLSLEPVQPA